MQKANLKENNIDILGFAARFLFLQTNWYSQDSCLQAVGLEMIIQTPTERTSARNLPFFSSHRTGVTSNLSGAFLDIFMYILSFFLFILFVYRFVPPLLLL